MARGWEDLPDECWEAILDRLKHRQDDIESLSLVSKRFLSFSNRLVSTLNISDRTVLLSPKGDISSLFRRFPFTKRIHLQGFHGDLDRLLRAVSRSDLGLEALDLSDQARLPTTIIKDLGSRMKATMKILICAHLHSLIDSDLITIADSFPALEELDISYPSYEHSSDTQVLQNNPSLATVTDSGISELSLKLPSLRSINLSGNSFISNRSLVALSSNCLLLSKICAQECSFLTSSGIDYVISHSRNLRSLLVDGEMISFTSPSFVESFCSNARTLQHLDLLRIPVSDDFLLRLGEAKLPLQKLVITCCRDFTFTGISGLLCLCRSLHHLDLVGLKFLTDEKMSTLYEDLQCLISLGLGSCSHLTNLTFFNLVKNCPSLEEIRMEKTSLGKGDSCMDVRKNCRIHSLKLGSNKHLNDDTLERIGTACSELRLLDVRNCWDVTDVGISAIGRCCTLITELIVGGCGRVQSLGSGLGFSKLEVLVACTSGFGDEGLAMLGQGCPRLRVLDLNGCPSVTDNGIEELARSNGGDKVLRKMSLNRCSNMTGNSFARLVFLCPSLKRIMSPASSIPTKSQRDLFLRHGCLVTDTEPLKDSSW